MGLTSAQQVLAGIWGAYFVGREATSITKEALQDHICTPSQKVIEGQKPDILCPPYEKPVEILAGSACFALSVFAAAGLLAVFKQKRRKN